ncbi:MurR/RpiR family transcriptional regulator [Nocardioides aquiterrae]|uniref:MurR/RpiR family transcriptional regulator n=1 Tax=Nocardioides aquiterrae TaxID=203799 RepID=A0ABN1UM72_9ACTN
MGSVASHTRESLATFSDSERKVARALLAAYPVAGLETVAQLAARAGVSPPTVVRFVARLGYSGYPAFQEALRHEVNEGMGSPLRQYGDHPAAPDNDDLLPYAASTFVETLRATFNELPPAEFARTVELLCDAKRSVYVVGGRFSRVLADYLTSHLKLLRPGVSMVTDDELERLAVGADVARGPVLVALDYRRYDVDTVRFAQWMDERGATVVLLTDQWLSPISRVAKVVLPSRVEAPSPFDSLVPAMAVVESLVAAVSAQLGERGRSRLELIEDTRQRWGSAPAPDRYERGSR